MADNYLEKRYEEVFGKSNGKKVSVSKPSLDTLLARINAFQGFDPSYKVHPLQIEAIVSSAQKISHPGIIFAYEYSDSIATVSISFPAEPDSILLGAIIQTISLKAAELGLRTEPRFSPELHCSISIGKPACE